MKIHIAAKGTYFEYYGHALRREFMSLGHDVILATRDTWEIDPVEADIHVIVSPNVYARPDVLALRGIRVGILTEQVPHIGFAENEEVLKRYNAFQTFHHDYDKLVEWSTANAEFLISRHPSRRDDFIVFPHGYIHRPMSGPMLNCQWDVCFIGDVSRSPRRQAILASLRDVGFKVCPYHENVWGQRKDEIFRQSSIVLNLHFSDGPRSFEAHRIFDVAPLSRCIVSELVNEPPNTTGGFLLQTDADGMPDMIRWLLNDTDNYGSDLRPYLSRHFPLQDLARRICEQ